MLSSKINIVIKLVVEIYATLHLTPKCFIHKTFEFNEKVLMFESGSKKNFSECQFFSERTRRVFEIRDTSEF